MCETTDDSPHANTVRGHITNQFEFESVEAVGDTLLQRDAVETLIRDKRTMIQEDALEYGSVPRYDYLSPEQRDRWKAHLAQKLEKAKSEVVPDDWDKASDWKVPSLTWASLDAGPRPCEFKRHIRRKGLDYQHKITIWLNLS